MLIIHLFSLLSRMSYCSCWLPELPEYDDVVWLPLPRTNIEIQQQFPEDGGEDNNINILSHALEPFNFHIKIVRGI